MIVMSLYTRDFLVCVKYCKQNHFLFDLFCLFILCLFSRYSKLHWLTVVGLQGKESVGTNYLSTQDLKYYPIEVKRVLQKQRNVKQGFPGVMKELQLIIPTTTTTSIDNDDNNNSRPKRHKSSPI